MVKDDPKPEGMLKEAMAKVLENEKGKNKKDNEKGKGN